MRIVAADPKDAAAADLMQALDAETLARYPGEPLFGIDADGFVEHGGVFLLGYVGGSAVACGALRPLGAHTLEIKRMYVRREFRGRSLSRRMYLRLEQIAQDLDCRVLKVETGSEQPEALGLYRSVGFAEIECYGPYVDNDYSICFAKILPDAEEQQFLRDFEQCRLAEQQWTHLAHIRVAWLYLTQMPSSNALARVRAGILRFNTEVLGRRQEYHETVTVAFCRIISDRIIAGEPWKEFAQRIDDVLNAEQPMLGKFYSNGLLDSEQARTVFIDGDIHQLPKFRDAHR